VSAPIRRVTPGAGRVTPAADRVTLFALNLSRFSSRVTLHVTPCVTPHMHNRPVVEVFS
jgi:hypothetical protein